MDSLRMIGKLHQLYYCFEGQDNAERHPNSVTICWWWLIKIRLNIRVLHYRPGLGIPKQLATFNWLLSYSDDYE